MVAVARRLGSLSRALASASKHSTVVAIATLRLSAAAAVFDAHPLVDRRLGLETGRLVAGDDGDATGPVGVGVRDAAVRRGADQAQPGSDDLGQRCRQDGDVEQRSRRGAHHLRVRLVDRPGCDDDGVGAGRLGRADDRAEVPRLADAVGDDDEVRWRGCRRRVVRRATTANSPGDVSRSDTRSATPGASPYIGSARRRDARRGRRSAPRRDQPAAHRLGDQRPALDDERVLLQNANCGARSGAAVVEPGGS